MEGTLVEGADDQQAAEAMVQLGNFGFFANPQQGTNIAPIITQGFHDFLFLDESIDVDPEYDPSDFLMSHQKSNYENRGRNLEDSAVDDASESAVQEYSTMEESRVGEQMELEESAKHAETAGDIDADLAISDSDDDQQLDEDNNEGLYF